MCDVVYLQSRGTQCGVVGGGGARIAKSSVPSKNLKRVKVINLTTSLFFRPIAVEPSRRSSSRDDSKAKLHLLSSQITSSLR
jgi:hypothetical protein